MDFIDECLLMSVLSALLAHQGFFLYNEMVRILTGSDVWQRKSEKKRII
jgi:hypothetical protein